MPTLPKKNFTPSYVPEPDKVTRATGDQAFLNTSAWRDVAVLHKTQNPLCENCYNKGRLRDVEETDHTIPRPIGKPLDFENLMSLCKRCHAQKSGKEGHAGGPLIAHLNGLPVDRTEIFKILT